MLLYKRAAALLISILLILAACPALAEDEAAALNGVVEMTNATKEDRSALSSSDAMLTAYYELWFEGLSNAYNRLYLMPEKLGLLTMSTSGYEESMTVQQLQAIWPTFSGDLTRYVLDLDTSESCVSSCLIGDVEYCLFSTTGSIGGLPVQLRYYLTFQKNTMILFETMLPGKAAFGTDEGKQALVQADDEALEECLVYLSDQLARAINGDGVPQYDKANISITMEGDDYARYYDVDRGFQTVVPTDYMYVTPDEAYDYYVSGVNGEFDTYTDEHRALMSYWLTDSIFFEMTMFYDEIDYGMVGVIKSDWYAHTLEEMDAEAETIIASLEDRMFDVQRLNVPTRYTILGVEYAMIAVSCRVIEGGDTYYYFVLSRTEGDTLQEINFWYGQTASAELVGELAQIVDNIDYGWSK